MHCCIVSLSWVNIRQNFRQIYLLLAYPTGNGQFLWFQVISNCMWSTLLAPSTKTSTHTHWGTVHVIQQHECGDHSCLHHGYMQTEWLNISSKIIHIHVVAHKKHPKEWKMSSTRVLISVKAMCHNYTSSSSLICNLNLSHSYHKWVFLGILVSVLFKFIITYAIQIFHTPITNEFS